jgi:hypothetical protein
VPNPQAQAAKPSTPTNEPESTDSVESAGFIRDERGLRFVKESED